MLGNYAETILCVTCGLIIPNAHGGCTYPVLLPYISLVCLIYNNSPAARHSVAVHYYLLLGTGGNTLGYMVHDYKYLTMVVLYFLGFGRKFS